MALETYALKVNGHRLTDIKIDPDTQPTEEIEAMVTEIATTDPTGVLPEGAVVSSISIDPVEKYVEIFA